MQQNDNLINKCFTSFLLSSVFATLGGNISIIIDNIIVSRFLGENALAAMSIVTPVFFCFTVLGILITAGASAVSSWYIGKDDFGSSSRFFTFAVVSLLVTVTIVCIIGSFFTEKIAMFFSGNSGLFPLVNEYLKALVPGGFALSLLYIPLNFFRIDGRGKLPVIMFLIMAATNTVFDIVFVVVFEIGMFGIGLATVLSAGISIVCVAPFLVDKHSSFRFVALNNINELFFQTLKFGSTPALNGFYSILRLFSLNGLILAVGGSIAVTAFSFANSINILALAFISGIAGTISPLVGIFLGEHDYKSIKTVVKLSVVRGVLYMSVFAVICVIFAKPMISLFGITSDNTVYHATKALIFMSISTVFSVLNTIFIYYYNVLGRTLIANIITLCKGFLFIVLLALYFGNVFGIMGIWTSFVVCEVLILMLFTCFSLLYSKRKKLSKVFLLDESRSVKHIEFSVQNTIESVVESSIKISGFCEECELSPKKAMLISLSIEEILTLIINYGTGTEKKLYIDIKIVQYEDMQIMRFRSGGRFFNPIDFYKKALMEESPLVDECLGIKMLLGLVSSIDYSTKLGLNNVVIII